VDGDPANLKPPLCFGTNGFSCTPVWHGGPEKDRLFAVSFFPHQTLQVFGTAASRC